MAITTYSELKTAIKNWNRDRDLSTYVDEFIDMAEAYFNAELRVREMEEVADLTPSSNVCTLPADYIEYITVVEKASTRRPLVMITKDVAEKWYPARESGLSDHFMIVGTELTALPLSSNTIELTYYEQIPALSSGNTTNWLLTKMPNLYLHASLMYAAEFMQDDEMIAKESAIVERFVGYLHAQDRRGKFANFQMQLTGPTP